MRRATSSWLSVESRNNMLAGLFHAGSGLGDQLHRYITVRTLAEGKGWEWDMAYPENFKGQSFMHNLQVPGDMPMDPIYKVWNEKAVYDKDGDDIRSYDPDINFVEDWTVIDGSFEDARYWSHNFPRINEWLKVDPLPVPRDLCMIGFRGGEYATVPSLFLTKDYWDKAINLMKERGITHFQVHTDDVELARQFFPDYECIHEIGFNWRSMRYAKYAIVANSAFYIMPRLLKHASDEWGHHHDAVTIAPRWWARHNIKKWARPATYYPAFTYVA